jgi:hypothetical protein
MATCVVAITAVAVAPGCNGGSCDETDACPVVDQSAAPGDLQYEFAPENLVGFTSGDNSGSTGLNGGELVIAPIDCPDPSHCTITVKRLSFRLDPITIRYSAGGSVTSEGTTVSLAAPVVMTGSLLDSFSFSIPAGTVAHTCGSLNGEPWHASAAVSSTQAALGVPFPSNGDALFDGTLPLVLRADDSKCSRFTFEATISATSSSTGAAVDAGFSD